MAAANVSYVLALPEGARTSAASMEGLLQSFGSAVVNYFERETELKERIPRGTPSAEPGPGSSPSPTGKSKDKEGKSRLLVSASGRNIRGGIASSTKAVITRRAKFGKSKLKVGTERKLRSKGFAIGKAPEIAQRTGQNKPKGRA